MKYLRVILLACLTLACQQKKIADKDDATAELDSLHPDSEDFSIDEVVPLDPYSNKDTFVYTREVEGFLYVHMIYKGKNIPIEAMVITQDQQSGIITEEEAFTYGLPEGTFSAVWFSRYHDGGTEFYALVNENKEINLYRIGYFGEDEKQKIKINHRLLGGWEKVGGNYEYMNFTGLGVSTDKFPVETSFEFDGKKMVIHRNPDEVFEVVSFSDKELQLRDSYQALIKYKR